MDPRIASACAAFIPAALGLGLVNLLIDGRISPVAAVVGVFLLVSLSVVMAAALADLKPKVTRRSRPRHGGIRPRESDSSEYDRATAANPQSASRLMELRAAASARLRDRMQAHGLHESEGWNVAESTRELPGGHEIVFRPFHAAHTAVARLECVVHVDRASGRVTHECRCE